MSPFLKKFMQFIILLALKEDLLGNVVGNIHHFLLSGVEPQHLHCGMEILKYFSSSFEIFLQNFSFNNVPNLNFWL